MQLLNLALILCVASAAGSASSVSSSRSLRASDSVKYLGPSIKVFTDLFVSKRDLLLKDIADKCVKASTPEERAAYVAKLNKEREVRTAKDHKNDMVEKKHKKNMADLLKNGINDQGLKVTPNAACPLDIKIFWDTVATTKGTTKSHIYEWNYWCKKGYPDKKVDKKDKNVAKACAVYEKDDPLGTASKFTIERMTNDVNVAKRELGVAKAERLEAATAAAEKKVNSKEKKLAFHEGQLKAMNPTTAAKDLYGCKVKALAPPGGGDPDIVTACKKIDIGDPLSSGGTGAEGDTIGKATLWCGYVFERGQGISTAQDNTFQDMCCPLRALAPESLKKRFDTLCKDYKPKY